MDLMGQLGDLLQQYSGAQGGAPPADVEQHYDQVAQGSSPASMAEGLLAAFMDTQHTPSFGNQAAQLFGASGGDTKAQVLNTLLAVAGPMMMQKMAGGQGGLDGACVDAQHWRHETRQARQRRRGRNHGGGQ